MTRDSRRALADVLREARALLARPDNDFAWSSWLDAAGALKEVDRLIAAIERGWPLSRFWGSMLFSPGGPIQEVSLSSGWGNEFVAIADRWDAALEGAPPGQAAAAPTGCRCATPPLDYRGFERREIGVDEAGGRYADVAIERCRRCGRQWLVYHYEIEACSRSGRWYRGLVSPEQAARATADDALATLAELPWHLYGGSFYGHAGARRDAPLDPAQA
jgi:hypothetical protein